MAESLKELGYQVLIVTALGATAATIAIFGDKNLQNSNENGGNGARISDQQYEPQVANTENPNTVLTIPNHTPGYITRDNPRSRFKIVPDPQNLGRLCVSKTNETPKNTLVGMTIVAAGDVNAYDGKGTVYDSTGKVIGHWDASQKLIGFEDLTAPAYADSIACGDN